jgi:hypothetical protein
MRKDTGASATEDNSNSDVILKPALFAGRRACTEVKELRREILSGIFRQLSKANNPTHQEINTLSKPLDGFECMATTAIYGTDRKAGIPRVSLVRTDASMPPVRRTMKLKHRTHTAPVNHPVAA